MKVTLLLAFLLTNEMSRSNYMISEVFPDSRAHQVWAGGQQKR